MIYVYICIIYILYLYMSDRREVAVCTLVFLFSPHPLPRKTYTILYLLGEGETAECLIEISSSI